MWLGSSLLIQSPSLNTGLFFVNLTNIQSAFGSIPELDPDPDNIVYSSSTFMCFGFLLPIGNVVYVM